MRPSLYHEREAGRCPRRECHRRLAGRYGVGEGPKAGDQEVGPGGGEVQEGRRRSS